MSKKREKEKDEKEFRRDQREKGAIKGKEGMDKEREKTSVYCKWQEIRELHLVLPLRIIEALPKTFLHFSSRPSFSAFDFSHSFFLIFFFILLLSFFVQPPSERKL